MKPPADENTIAKAHALLDRADSESSDYTYAELVCSAADIATLIERTSPPQALPIWQRIAHLDDERARLYELVDEARQKLQKAGVAGPSTISQDYEEHLASLPPDQRLMNLAKYCLRIITSNENRARKAQAAQEGLQAVSEHEQSKTLNAKQRLMKQAFQDLVDGKS